MLLAGPLVAACTTTAGGTPTSVTTSDAPTSATSGEAPGEGAPPVENPLDAGIFIEQPCTTLTQDQLSTLGVSRPGVPTTSGAVAERAGPYCTWLISEQGGAIGIGFITGNKNGLSDNYRAREEFAYFEPTTVEGYPAVFSDRSDLRDSGSCSLFVGIADTLTILATETGQLDAQGACDRAKQVAAAAVTTMGGGG
ncbi:DUF3558 domain-containing protein [Actinophytocola xanthii]|nr:DUF3558 domain-containing protein [Actinophytocola xanthii]